MPGKYSNEPMLEMYIFETSQLLEQLEHAIIICEKVNNYSIDAINEIFRFMHTIKGSSAMMLFNEIGSLAHAIEDLFYYLREQKPESVDCSTLSDLVLEGVDFIKIELEKIKAADTPDGDPQKLNDKIKAFLSLLKSGNPSEVELVRPVSNKQQQYYISPDKKADEIRQNRFRATIKFNDGCEMENIRAYTVIHSLIDTANEVFYIPEDISENEDSVLWIRENGFEIYFATEENYEEMNRFFMQTVFLKSLDLVQLENDDEFQQFNKPKKSVIENNNEIKMPQIERAINKEQTIKEMAGASNQVIISVNVDKLDKLMDLVGEMVIAEAMVTQNPEVKNLELENFHKAARQLHKITGELQDMVMSIRMVPLSTTFLKMQRIMRDMCKKLNKEVRLEVVGEETEVDKNIIENISDPLMHLIRNAIDHGIEENDERVNKGKERVGKVTLEAKNSGSDVLVIIKDDGKGLKKERILNKARENGLLEKNENEMSDREIYNLILLPGFSTKESVTEFSGRGVGMDVVTKNIEAVGGSVTVDSVEEVGTTITLKIPLTLAIIDGMNIRVGNSRYTIPIITIKESFRPKKSEVITDPDENEMIMVRGQCYPILRLHKHYKVATKITELTDGILIMVEQDDKTCCIFADELIGQQQVVVKALPAYIKKTKSIDGLGGCTLLGDGSISLILDIGGLTNRLT
ncbi:MAG: chemotaxis protein CheA [Firmicutes bacterium HGW-Firmicutes-7]|nr:MAG: chemotaxis protein CheA [Firmicutes bacterium HGW-Firmicutes-7]